MAYTSLIIADFQPLEKTHSVEKLHGMLKDETRKTVEVYITEAGWGDSESLLKYLDETMTQRKQRSPKWNPPKTLKK